MPTTATRIDDCLCVREGRLWMEECDTVELARRFGTPVHVVSEDQLRRTARRIHAAFAAAWPEGDVRLLPSLKANFSLALRAILNAEGLGCDTFGMSELEAALRTGIDPALVSVNGSVKDATLVRRAVEAGARITLDAPGELDLVAAAARDTGRTAVIRLRLRPDYDGLDAHRSDFDPDASVRVAAHRYKPGIPLEQAGETARRALATPGVELRGLMAHLGRHSADPAVWNLMGASFAAAVARVCAETDGWRPAELDAGGGYPPPRDPTGAGPAPPIEEIAAALAGGLRDGLRAAGIDPAGITLEAEPGRALYADSGIHLTTVRNRKEQTAPVPWRWIETDTSEIFLLDLLIEHARFPVVAAGRASDPDDEPADVVGLSCGFDVLAFQARLPAVEPGDVLAFLDTGAYQDAAAGNFNALPRPGTVLVHGGEAEWIKRPETVQDVFARDVVPDRLS